MPVSRKTRNLVIVLGDQLDAGSAAFDGFDPRVDRVWMAEVHREATHVWSHKQRLVFFFAAMRHFRDSLRERGWEVNYHELTADSGQDRGGSFPEILSRDLDERPAERIVMVRPGDWRVWREFEDLFQSRDAEFEYRADRHFFIEPEQFSMWAVQRNGLVLENFYRWMRKEFGYLMEDGQPAGGCWNFDSENRQTFPKSGPQPAPLPRFESDAVTDAVRELVTTRFAAHPGSLDAFDYPVTAVQARIALADFVNHRLADFGAYQDAMWQDEAYLYHSRLSAVMNVKLLSARAVVEMAIGAWQTGRAPLNSVEGFVRQVLGWREFVRGVYWHFMPSYAEMNELGCDSDADVPPEFWHGQSSMNCVRQAMQGVVGHAYAHHIHRLMILGLYAQLLGVHPRRFHEWHMAMYADAIDWVSLPNTLGMSQFGDGGIIATKPYCASGNYVHKMSNYCQGCQFDYRAATGPKACPLTTLYWDFLDRHHERFVRNGRMLFQIRNLEKKSPDEMATIRLAAANLRMTARTEVAEGRPPDDSPAVR